MGLGLRDIVCHLAVLYLDNTVSHGGYRLIVGDDYHCHTLFTAGILQKLQYCLARVIVESARRLIAEQELG